MNFFDKLIAFFNSLINRDKENETALLKPTPVFDAPKEKNKKKSLTSRMFFNVGRTIKKIAKILFIIGVVASIIMGIVILASGYDKSLQTKGDQSYAWVLFGILAPIIGTFISWLNCIFIYSYGCLVENSADIAMHTCPEEKRDFYDPYS